MIKRKEENMTKIMIEIEILIEIQDKKEMIHIIDIVVEEEFKN